VLAGEVADQLDGFEVRSGHVVVALEAQGAGFDAREDRVGFGVGDVA